MMILLAWVGYALLATGVFSLVFLWAVRSRQFADQDRARYLPLHALNLSADTGKPGVPESREGYGRA